MVVVVVVVVVAVTDAATVPSLVPRSGRRAPVGRSRLGGTSEEADVTQTGGPPVARPRHGPLWWTGAAVTTAGMLVALWLYSASGLLAPLWAVVLLLVVWLALAVLAVRVHRRRGAWSLLVPVAAVALWVAVLGLGEAVLGWTG